MNLLSQYTILQPLRRVRLTSGGAYSFWDDFLNTDDHACIIAARRTGKTHHVLKRALLRRDKDVIIVFGNDVFKRQAQDAFVQMLADDRWTDVEISGDGRGTQTYTYDDHSVSFVSSLEGSQASWYADKEVIFHEPEILRHIPNFNIYLQELPDMRVIMVGSLARLGPSRFKDFFVYCSTNGYAEKMTAERIPALFEESQENRRAGWITEETWLREYMCETQSRPIHYEEYR